MIFEQHLYSSRKIVVGWNTLAQFLGKVVSAGVMFLISLIIARKFGVNGFGDFTKITTYIAFFYLLVDFGLNAIFLQKEQTSSGNWSHLLILRIIGSLVIIFLSLLFLFLLPQGTSQGFTPFVKLGIILYSPTILFQALITTANALFQKHLRYDLSSLALITGDIISLILITLAAYLVSSGSGAVAVATALMLGSAATGIISLGLVSRLSESQKLSLTLKSAKELLIAGLPLGVMLVFNQVYFRFDSLVLALTRSTAEVGVYGLAYKVFEMPLVIPTFFMNAMYPMMLKTKNYEALNSNRELKHLIKHAFIFLLIASGFLLFIFWLAAPLLTLIRPAFSESIPALRVLVLSLPLFFTTSLLMWIIVTLEEQKILPLIYGISMLFIIIADIIFIPKYGYISAAWITVVAEGFVLLLLSLSTLWLFKIRKLTKIRKL